jgi:hypothetical protein
MCGECHCCWDLNVSECPPGSDAKRGNKGVNAVVRGTGLHLVGAAVFLKTQVDTKLV